MFTITSILIIMVILCFFLQECTNVFSKGGGEALAKEYHVPFLGKFRNSVIT